MRKCNRCKTEKSLKEFTFRADGKYDCYCKSCRSEYSKEKYYQKKKERIEKVKAYRKTHGLWKANYEGHWFTEYKKTLKCSRCPENHPSCLDFHHINPQEKEFSISQKAWRYSKERIMKEISKCIILCANCHRKEHWS